MKMIRRATNADPTELPSTSRMPTPGADDDASGRVWVADFQAGVHKEAAFRQIFERFHRPVENFFRRRGVPPEDRLDLVQETFLGVYRGLPDWRPEALFGSWVFQIATTTYLKYRRARGAAKRSGQEVSHEDVWTAPQLAEDAEQLDDVLVAERREAVAGAMADLPERMRHCLVLRLDHGLKYREIATLMQVSIQTVKAHLFQAKDRLATQLDRPLRAQETEP